MDDLPDLPEHIDLIELPDGSTLDQRQSKAVMLAAMTDLANSEIAERCGYASAAGVWQLLNSDRGRAGLELAIRRHLLEGARVGLRTMVKLAKSAKSENVRQMAAADLMNRARLELDSAGQGGPRRSGDSFQINISLGQGDPEPKVVTLNGSAHEVKHDD